jgi:hypothetical protein
MKLSLVIGALTFFALQSTSFFPAGQLAAKYRLVHGVPHGFVNVPTGNTTSPVFAHSVV